jgi:hypothetical protein
MTTSRDIRDFQISLSEKFGTGRYFHGEETSHLTILLNRLLIVTSCYSDELCCSKAGKCFTAVSLFAVCSCVKESKHW